ncbi:MAG: ATP-binding protein [Balneola sp.]|nr:ATP-binding protein [Balneola sp.]MBO6651610.1 ATP-binding protein [Balneola sp.]MBO6710724.1 ATP-binding protein [Balneola sp.]MBO6799410.1 ATP-binding protein [Balneola sp.]MBO6869461.1 ATP-binding protein [Balneola sp.]
MGDIKTKYLCLLISFLLSLPLFGQGFSFYEYFSPEDLSNSHPQNWAAIQDTNGYVFIANGSGYLVNDGNNWLAGHIGETGRGTSFFVSSTGMFYANGHSDFGKLVPDSSNRIIYKSISSTHYSEAQYIPIIWDAYEINGKIYNRHNYGIVKYDPFSGTVKDYTFKANQDILWGSFQSNKDIFVDSNDGLWMFRDSVYTLMKSLKELKNERLAFSERLNSQETLLGIWRGSKRSKEKSIYIFRNGVAKVFETEADEYLSLNISYKATTLKDGTIVIATLTGGIVFLEQNGSLKKIFTENNGLEINEVYNLYVDHENQLWITLSSGVQKLDLNESLRNYNEVHGLVGTIEDIILIENTVWAISGSGIFKSYTLSPENTLGFTHFDNPNGLPMNGLFSINKIPYTYGDSGIFELSNEGIKKQIFNEPVNSTVFDKSSNTVLLIGKSKTFEFDGSSIIEKSANIEVTGYYSALYENSLFIMSSSSNQVFRLEKDSLIEIPIQKNPDGRINLNHIGVIDNKLYIGVDGTETNNGLFVFNKSKNLFERDYNFGKNTPLYSKQVFTFQQCENGDIWFSSDNKVIKATKNKSDWNLVGKFYRKVSELKAYSFECTKSGVWIGGNKSITFINNDFSLDSVNFKTNITGMYVERDSLVFGGYGEPVNPIVLPFRDNELRFNYAAASYIDPELNTYQYKLDGFDDDWSEWSLETQKDYTNLSEGEYVFKVKSRNVYEADGEMDTITFTILPPWYRTWWAYLLYVVVIAGILYGLYKIRINQILKIQGVRNRIADDLHDDLSGTLIGISNFAKAITKNPDKDTRERFIGLIEKSADEAKEKISDIVWTINPTHDEWTNFLTKCRRHASDIFEAQNIEYALEMDENIPGQLEMELRKNLWLIFKEIVTNIIKHAEAEYVLIRFATESGKLNITIRDKGKGFDINALKSGNGINNIKKRVETIKGKVKLESTPSEGTIWNIEVPV